MTASDAGDSFETERHRDDQPQRDDLLDPEEITDERRDEPDPRTGAETGEADRLPDAETRPESQGEDVLDAPHATEDATPRRRLSDEEAEDQPRGPQP